MLAASGTTPLWQARLVPMPAQLDAGQVERPADDADEVGGEDPLAQVAELDHEHHAVGPALRATAAADSATSTSTSVLQLTSAAATTRSTWLGIGERMRVIGAVMPAARSRSTFSIRESPRPVAPAASSTRATSGEPSVALVTAVTRDAPVAEAGDEGGGVVGEAVEVDLEPRRAHPAAAVGSFSSSAGKACTTISTRRSGERVSASVAGMPSSAS